MIRVNGVYKSFDTRLVLDDITFSLKSGGIAGLVGPSGAGKSVLLKIIGQILSADRGSVSIDSSGVGEVGFLFQEGALFDSLSVVENVVFPLQSSAAYRGVKEEELFAKAVDILDEVGLKKAVDKYPGQLSGGMRRRVALARALVGRPATVLLDDPTEGLDPVAASVILELIKDLHSRYSPTVLIVSHDIRRLIPNVERVLALFDGRIVCDESRGDLKSAASEEVLRFLSTRYDFNSA